MKVVPVDLSLIDFEDHTFYIGHNVSSLKDSISEVGVLNPPILREAGGNYVIVCGWRRLLSCKELDHTEAICSVYGPELSDRDCLGIIFLDNKERMSELEIGELILLHRTLCNLDDKELIEEILPKFEIAPSRKNLDKFLALSELEEEIKNAFFEHKISIEQCQMLSELDSVDRVPILENVLLKYKLNNNESRQVIQHISEAYSIYLKSILEVIPEAENAGSGDKIDKNMLRSNLKRMRYPDLSKIEEKVKERIKEMGLPDGVNVFINQFFEANDVEIRLKVSSSEDLLEICRYLESMCESGDIDSLISLIKEGL